MNARPGSRSHRVRRLLDELGFTGAGVAGWRERAACVGCDPDLFFPQVGAPDHHAQVTAARKVCAVCPVRVACLAEVMAWEDPARRVGVFAGRTPIERAELFQHRRQEVA